MRRHTPSRRIRPNYLNNDYGTSDFNLNNRLVIDFTWDLPWRPIFQAFRRVDDKWHFVAESGQPYTIFSGSWGKN